MASTRKPLSVTELPEILREIFRYLEDDRKTLKSVILVNRTWFDCGLLFLWQTPPTSAITAVPESRRQIYASNIALLDLGGEDGLEGEIHERLKDLNFSSLKGVSIDSYRPRKNKGKLFLGQYLQPTLEYILIFGANLKPEFFHDLMCKCRRLKWLLLDSPGQYITPNMLLTYLKGSPSSLQRINLTVGVSHLLTEEVLFHLAARENLGLLTLETISPDILEKISSAVPQPFKDLHHLAVAEIQSCAVPIVTGMLKNIQKLELRVKDRETEVLQWISQLSNLKFLSLNFHLQDIQIHKQDLMLLKKLTHLEELYLDMVSDDSPQVSIIDLTDDDFDRLVSSFPRLNLLNFGAQCALSVAALRSLSKRCPRLKHCALRQTFNMQQLLRDNERITFPNLLSLEIVEFVCPPIESALGNDFTESAAEIAEFLNTQCPRLKDLEVNAEVDDEFSDTVVQIFMEMSEADRG